MRADPSSPGGVQPHGPLQVVRLADMPPQPWKNGGGITRDLLAWPDAAGWHCRISVAEVARSGPFSAYPGVDRWFAVVTGAGVVLHGPGGSRRMAPGDEPLAFDGADAPGCDLVEGATLDLNLMVQRTAGRGALRRADGKPWHDPAPLRALFTTAPAVLHAGASPPLQLPAMSLAWTARSSGEPWRLAGAPQQHGRSAPDSSPATTRPLAWWISFTPLPA